MLVYFLKSQLQQTETEEDSGEQQGVVDNWHNCGSMQHTLHRGDLHHGNKIFTMLTQAFLRHRNALCLPWYRGWRWHQQQSEPDGYSGEQWQWQTICFEILTHLLSATKVSEQYPAPKQ
jgi:hypothetical protein